MGNNFKPTTGSITCPLSKEQILELNRKQKEYQNNKEEELCDIHKRVVKNYRERNIQPFTENTHLTVKFFIEDYDYIVFKQYDNDDYENPTLSNFSFKNEYYNYKAVKIIKGLIQELDYNKFYTDLESFTD